MKGEVSLTHYFKNSENLAHNRKEITFRFLGIFYTLQVDAGVFSKTKPDDGSLLLVENVLKHAPRGKALDMGCGYGLISLILKHQIETLDVTGIDVNQRAIECANESAKAMKLDLNFINQDILLGYDASFDCIVTNPPIRAGKKIVYAFFDYAQSHLNKEGQFFVVIRRQQGAASAYKALQERFAHVKRLDLRKGYEILFAQNPLT